MSDGIAIVYRAGGGFPAVDLDLRIDAGGQGTLYLGTAASLPNHEVARIGDFAGPVDPATLAGLRELARAQTPPARSGTFGQAEPHAPSRYLAVTRDGAQAEFRLEGMTADPGLDAAERALQDAAFSLTARPVAALAATLETRAVSGGTEFTICLRGLGTKPAAVILIDVGAGARLNAQVQIEARMPLPSGAFLPMAFATRDLPAEAATRLVESGALGAGEVAIAPEQTVRIPLPPVDLAASQQQLFATGTVSFWKPEGAARRGMTARTQTLALP